MAKIVISKKFIIFGSQIIAGLIVLAFVLIFQLGAFAGSNDVTPSSTSVPDGVSPTLLEAPKPSPIQTVTAEVTEEPDNAGSSNFNGETPASRACAEQMRASGEAANAVLRQASQLWDQMLALEAAAAASTDPIQAENLRAQASALEAESLRLNDQGIQMQADRFGGHRGMGCDSNGIFYTD